MTTESPQPLWKQRIPMFAAFTRHTSGLLEYGGVRADLRPAARKSPEQAPEANRYVLQWVYNEGADYAELTRPRGVHETLLLTAGLMAHFPKAATLAQRWEHHRTRASKEVRAPYLDVGLALAEADHKDGKIPGRGANPQTMTPREKRLMQLCRSDRGRLHRHLFALLSYLHGQRTPLPDWTRLAIDVDRRRYAPDAVARSWQESYLRRPPWRGTDS